MIVRTWTAHTTPDRELAYLEQVREVVLPHLREIPGYLGSRFLRRHTKGEVEFLVLTYWESMAAVEALSGGDSSQAYLPPEIAATLERFDHEALQFEVLLDDSAGE